MHSPINGLTFCIHTFGCQMNKHDSERIAGMLEALGALMVETVEESDVVVFMTCCVREAADTRLYGQVASMKNIPLRAESPLSKRVIAVGGCIGQRDGEKLTEALPHLDVVFGTHNLGSLPRLLEAAIEGQGKQVEVLAASSEFPTKLPTSREHSWAAWLPITIGCNNFCSYCIIPYARGRVRSKPLEDLKAELAGLGANGYKEVVLTGINLSAYGQEFGLHLCDAIEAACATPGIERVRLGSLEPEQLSEDVIRRMAKQKKLCPQFHLSLQSGCDATLKRMNRHYTADEYRTIVRNLRAAFENAAITTDIMVGFAGETDEEFAESLAFAEEIAFAKVHVFAYSRRPGTRAYDMGDQLTNAVKEARSHEMIRVTTATQQAFFKAQIGRTEEVLFEREIQKGVWEGYSMNYTPVAVASGTSLAGEIRSVRIESCTDTHCMGAVL